jgi:hypothetical protein
LIFKTESELKKDWYNIKSLKPEIFDCGRAAGIQMPGLPN